MATKRHNQEMPPVRLKLFDLIALLCIAAGLMMFVILTFRKTEFVSVTVRVTNLAPIFGYDDPPSWYAYALTKGAKEKDGFGRTQAELTDVRMFPVQPTNYFFSGRKTVYATISVRAVWNRSSESFTYRGKQLIIGAPFKVELQNQLIEGVITGVNDKGQKGNQKIIVVRTYLPNLNPQLFRETIGVEPHIADAVREGDVMRASDGSAIATIVKKTVTPAVRHGFDAAGAATTSLDPVLKYVELDLRISVTETAREYYFSDKVRVAIGESLPVDFGNVVLQPIVSSFISQ